MRLRRKSYLKKTWVNRVNPLNSWSLQWEWENELFFFIKKALIKKIEKNINPINSVLWGGVIIKTPSHFVFSC
jgi:hypothetical protein